MATWDEDIVKGIKSGYFNSVETSEGVYDRPYNAEDMTNYFEGLISNGVYAGVGDELKVTASGFTLTVGTGRAMIDCRWMRVSKAQNFTIASADTVSDRKDLVVVKLDLSAGARQMALEVMQGVSGYPTDTDDVKYLILAEITVPANASFISVKDMRRSSYCGFVSSLTNRTTITQERSTNHIAADGNSFLIFIDDFDVNSDILLVFLNGLQMVYGEEYTIEDNQIKTTNKLKAGGVLSFICLKGAKAEAGETA